MTKSRGIRNPKGTRSKWVAENQGKHFCGCECGRAIPLRPEHFNTGVPRYLHGHNPQKKRPPSPMRTCECGCGAVIKAISDHGRPVRFVVGHNRRGKPQPQHAREAIRQSRIGARNPMFGKVPHNFVGRTRHTDGYIMVYAPDHPYITNRGSVMEHRLVIEEHLRKTDPASPYLIEVDGELYLRREIEVHHVNGVKDDNSVENLQPMTKAEHAAHHQADRSRSS